MTNDRPAVSGGIDYLHSKQHYMGFWLTNIEDRQDDNNEGSKIDIYAGTHQPLGDFDVELGVLHYYFNRGNHFNPGITQNGKLEPDSANDSSFTELLLSVKRGIFTARVYNSEDYYGSGFSSYYWQVGVDYPIREDIVLEAYYGLTDSEAVPDHGGMVNDFLVTLHKDEFSLSWANLDDHEDGRQSENFRLTVSWRHSIKL
jgi:uncharacterized protein (TIGR02001 family)